MPYNSISNLPDAVRDNLPKHAQEIYKEAFNNSYERYEHPDNRREKGESQEEAAHRTAWSAVKKDYKKGDDDKWHRKES